MSSCFEDGKFFPPGFRFHPTDEELVLYYLKRKICRRPHRLDVIGETDVYKWDPEELPGISKLKTGDRQWFFFNPRDRKYPNGARSNRATRHGYWKVTGRDRIITCNSRAVGVKKTLVFYKGRAPTGERTDWVMHEYTMDEDELKRCRFAQDYYALCKVYKKSGPGPKNGEQYGAHFREEEWADEEFNVNGDIASENTKKEVDEAVPLGDDGINCQVDSELNDLEKLMKKIADEAVLVADPAIDCSYALDNVVGEEEAHSNLVDQTLKEYELPEQSTIIQSACQQYNMQASYDLAQSGTSQVQLPEVPEVTSAPKSHVPELHVVEEDFLEDFLEMDDLIGPEPTVQNSGKSMGALENLQIDYVDGLSEFDLFKDESFFLCDSETGGQGLNSEPYVTNLENKATHPVPNLDVNNFDTGSINYYQQTHFSKENEVAFQQWGYDHGCDVLTSVEAHQGTMPPVIPDTKTNDDSGVSCDGNSAYQNTGANQNDSRKQDDGTDSWFSSALWAFVESIPTAPASASESALVNRAFERMSSFSRARINARNMNVTGGDTSATSKSSGKFKTAFFCFSLLGLVCAIFWMLMGTPMREAWKHTCPHKLCK